ncbi:MAG: YHS domain-containing protein [Desulfobacteraceae bacterium]|nr:YHS domain-containing protein [Desulfobacteraceae bacterium]
MATRHKINIDPVCGLVVEPATAPAKTNYNQIEYYFCTQGCHDKFQAAPQNYLPKKRKGFWQHYLERVNKATGGRPPACCH